MKTFKNNSTTIKTVKIIFSFFILGAYLTIANAENSEIKKMTPLTIEMVAPTYTLVNTTFFEINDNLELHLSVEKWMMDVNSFSSLTFTDDFSDESIEVEEWMTDVNAFTTLDLGEEFNDEAIDVEKWMTDPAMFFDVNSVVIEESLKVEAWMLDVDSFFK